jgi:hypothetical protein
MSETRKTLTIGVLGLLFLVVIVLTAPRRVTPDEFVDRGEVFFPEFTDPNAATTLEVIEFEEETASAKPFKVTYKNGVWTIPSHNDYPADGKDRLAKTAAGLIGLTKDDFRTANVADYEACGVIDPLDESATSLKGRGKRVTIKDAGDHVLADLILGRKLDDHPEYRFVRIPDQKRVYVTRSDLDVSTNFADWIEADLLQVERNDIDDVTIRDYSIDERYYTVDRRDVLTLTRKEGTWAANRMNSKQEVDTTRMNELLRALDELSIVGVRPKPPGLSDDLKKAGGRVPLTQENVMALQEKGYYFTSEGDLLSNEGEVEVETNKGVAYVLRFGEVLYGRGESVSAGDTSNQDKEAGPGLNRYLFITVSFDPRRLPEPKKPAGRSFDGKEDNQLTDEERADKELDGKHQEWQKQIDEGREKVRQLNERFAGWYYVISSDSFDKIHLTRKDLVKAKAG